ncbi:MAG: SRPBCC domain-containing protein [Crocinitomicaceae bacterium]
MKDFYTELFINATTEKVWNAFVKPNQFFKAFYVADIRSTFNIGDRIEYSGLYEGKDTVHIYGKVLEYDEGKCLAYTDHPGPLFMEGHASMESVVKVTFEAIGQSTRLTLSNDQFSENNPMQAEAKQWYLILSNLKTWIETGQLLNLPNQ